MAEFIVRARAAPVDPDLFRSARGQGIEYLADILKAGLLISQGHRLDSQVHLVLEKSRDYSRVVTFNGAKLGSFPDLQESTLLDAIADGLRAAMSLNKDETIQNKQGLEIQTTSFEHLVKRKAEHQPTFVLGQDGEDVRELDLPDHSVFVLTDHTPMPKKTFKSMARQGVVPISLGPVMLHSSQCISILLNELDRRS